MANFSKKKIILFCFLLFIFLSIGLTAEALTSCLNYKNSSWCGDSYCDPGTYCTGNYIMCSDGYGCVCDVECISGDCSGGVCVSAPSAPSCWTCSDSLYDSWCDDNYCDSGCGETVNPSSDCYCGGDCVPSCWTCSKSYYYSWCGDDYCDDGCGEDTSSGACYCSNDCRQCGESCSDDNDCVSSCPYCSGGVCKSSVCKDNGESCTAASQCCSGYCVDGVCCNNSCTGTCRTCYFSSTYKGTCYYWNSDTDPDNECYGTGTCGGTCNGSGACQYPSTSVSCGTKDCDYLDTTCRNYYDVTRYCNGAGSCGDPTCNSYTNASYGTDCGTCKICNSSGSCASTPADDSACGTIDCDGLDSYYQDPSGDSPTGTDKCWYRNYSDLTSNRCEGFGDCKDANTTADCTSYSDSYQYECGYCKYIPSNYCTGSTKGSCANYAKGTSCGTNKECNGSGTCVTCYYPTGTTSASKTTVETGETFTVSVAGHDDDHDVWQLTYNKGSNVWNATNEQTCLLQQYDCTKSWNITESTAGTYTYYGRVRDSDDVHGCSSWHEAGAGSVTVTVTQVDPPTARTDPATNVEETTATLHGTITNTGGADYRVRFQWGDTSSYGSNSSWTGYYSYTTSFYLDISGLTRGKTYHFRIQAENSAGYGYGSDRTFITKPNPPSSFTATAVSGSQIDLSWSKGSGAYYTMIRRSTTGYPTSPTSGTQVYYDTGTSYSDTGLTAGTTYYYSAWSRAYEEGYYQYSDTYVTVSETATTPQRDCDLACKNLGYPGGYCAARDWAREQCVLGGYSSEVVDIGFQGECVVPPLLIGSCQCCQPMINTKIDCAFSNCIFDKTSVVVDGQVAVGGYLKTTGGAGIAGEYLSLWMWNGTSYEHVTEDGMDSIGPTNSSGYAGKYWTPSSSYEGTKNYILFFAGTDLYNQSQTTFSYSLTVIAVCPGPDNLRWGPINGIFYSGQFKILWDPVATASTYRLEWCEEGYSFGDSGCCPDYPNCYRVTSNTETDVYNLTPCKRYSWRVRVASATGCGTPGEWSNLVMPYAICPGCALGYFPGYECGFIESQSAASCILGYNNSLVGGSAFKANCYDAGTTLCMADKCPSLSNSPSPEYSSELQTYSDGAVCNANVPSLTLDFMRSRTGVWDASEYKCIRCSGKFEDKICGDETKLYASVDVDVCTKAGNGKCEAACGAATECDEKNPGDSCAFGVCDTSCNCTCPDLVITNGWDATGTIRYTITNQGTGNAGESYTALYIKNTADNWVYKANDYEAALSAGSSRSGSEQSFPTYTLSDRATDCVDRAEMPVSVCADYYSPRVDESNEGNNCFEFTVTCDATPPTVTITTNPSPTNNWFRDDFTAQFEFRDSGGSGLAVCQYKIECDGWTTGWLNKPCSGNGPVNASRVVRVGAGEECNAQGYDACKIYAHVEDGAGNSPPNPEEAYGIDYEAPTTE